MKATQKLSWYVSTLTEVFLIQKRINVCENTVKMGHVTVLSKSHQGEEQEEGRGWREN